MLFAAVDDLATTDGSKLGSATVGRSAATISSLGPSNVLFIKLETKEVSVNSFFPSILELIE